MPQLMQAQGYTTFNNGKTDYNFVWDAASYNFNLKSKTNLKPLLKRQPFFGQIQIQGGKNNTAKFSAERKVDPSKVSVPADYPDNEMYREVVAQHYDAIRMDDDLIGKILQGLKDAGLDENTIVVYFSDHGANKLLRHKQMTTEGGLRVPFMVMGPEKYIPKKRVRNDLVNMLDLSATTLAWGGATIPSWYEGQNLFGENFQARSFVASQKDRLDHTIDRVRSVRTEQYRYVRNYKLDRIFLQPQYRDKHNYTQNLHQLYHEGKLSDRHREIYFGERPSEELYDVNVDPCMMKNLVGNESFVEVLGNHREILSDWLAKGDKGVEEESIAALKANGENQRWGEGVNVEYEVYRPDQDGDGLSDKWETLNGRDPNDGRLLFEFNCGGWQTEGWFSNDMRSNLAGYLGFLDFELPASEGTIRREDLSVIASDKDKAILLKARANAELTVRLRANGKVLGEAKIPNAESFSSIEVGLNADQWSGTVHSLELSFYGEQGTMIEVDSIQVKRR